MSKSKKDVAILFALQEEFEEYFPFIGSHQTIERDESTGRSFYLFLRSAKTTDALYTCVTTFVGSMGAQDAGFLTSELIRRYSPRSIVLVGIAGSLTKDIFVGDVIVADTIHDYLQDARAQPSGRGFTFVLSGRQYRPNARLVNYLRHLKFSESFKALSAQSQADLADVFAKAHLKPKQSKVLGQVTRGNDIAISVGHLASGSVVGAAQSFTEWLLSNSDRKYLAIEMESAGVMQAIYEGAGDERALILRGVSDLSDERKASMDSIDKGSLRRWAMRNAIRVLDALFDDSAFERQANITETQLIVAEPPMAFSLVADQDWIDAILGPDPILGIRTVEPSTQVTVERFQQLFARDEHFGLQAVYRVPQAAYHIDSQIAPFLRELIQKGSWEQKCNAALCFRKIPARIAADQIAAMLSDHGSAMDATRNFIESLGWMRADGWAGTIKELTTSGDYEFGKLHFFALRAFALMLFQSKEDQAFLQFSVSRIETLIRFWRDKAAEWMEPLDMQSIDAACFNRGGKISPESCQAILGWFSSSEVVLRYVAWSAYHRTRNPRGVDRAMEAYAAERDPIVRSTILDYLSACSNAYSANVILEMLKRASSDEDRLSLLTAASRMMYAFSESEADQLISEIWREGDDLMRAQSLYTAGLQSANHRQAFDLTTSNLPVARAVAAIVLATREPEAERARVRTAISYSATAVERILLRAALVRCSPSPTTADQLHRELCSLPGIDKLDYLWRREAVYTVSAIGVDGPKRGQGWGELMDVSPADAEEEMNQFGPIAQR